MGEIFLKRVENDIYIRDRKNTSVCVVAGKRITERERERGREREVEMKVKVK
jgi:hypothetical protein